MTQRLLSLVFIFIILSLLFWLLFIGARDEILPIDTELPNIEFSAIHGVKKLKKQGKPLIIVFFSTTCEHCRYQLEVFDEYLSELSGTDIYLFTSETNLYSNSSVSKWQNLLNASNVTFGIVDVENFKNTFGSILTPTLFFFTDQGKLREKIRGELKPQRIFEITKSLKSGQTQSSGNN